MPDTLPAHPAKEWILLTNDDGIDSPALPVLMAALAQLRPVVGVIPASEHSWTSKTLSRFAQPRLEAREQNDSRAELYALQGSPADCANLGIHNLYRNPPVLVVSGTNIGANAGLAFLLSSGTVGAAIEAMLAGVPALALSVQMRTGDYARWREQRSSDFLEDTWTQAAAVGREVAAQILSGGLPAQAGVLSVNMPAAVTLGSARRLTGVTPTTYGPFFRRRDDGAFEHHYRGFEKLDADADGDVEALDRGEVALTPLRFDLAAAVEDDDRRRFEQRS